MFHSIPETCIIQDLPKEKATHSLTATEELVSASQIMKKEIDKSMEDFVNRISLHGVANVGSSQNSLDSGIANCSNLSLEQTFQPAVFLEDRSVLNTQMDRFNHEVITLSCYNYGQNSSIVFIAIASS